MAPAVFKPVAGLATGLSGVLLALVVAISTGNLRVPLPAPGHNNYVNLVAPGVLPWTPRPLKGVFAPNERLLHAVRLFEGQVEGPESVSFSEAGNLALLDKHGNVYEALLESGCGNGRGSSTIGDDVASSGSDGRNLQRNDGISYVLNPRAITHLGSGRPLGSHYDAESNLVVCDSLKGLVKYDADIDEVSILANRVSPRSALDPESEVTYANDLAIAADGRVFFTSCSDISPMRVREGYYDTFGAWMMGLAQGLPRGRLLMYDPSTRETVVLAKGMYYGNGVALSADESYLVIAETDRLRLLKYWLEGPKAGTLEPLLENLPGAPDGVSAAPDGGFWVALVSPVPPIAKLLKDPVVRALYAWLPAWARPPLKKWGAVAKVSGDGVVLDFLMDPTGAHISSVSAAVEHDGCLFLGNLHGNYVSYVDVATGEADNTCWCSCSCNGKKLETPVRLRPPEGEEGQQIYAGLMENDRALARLRLRQQQQGQQQQQQGEQLEKEGGEGEGAVHYDGEGSAEFGVPSAAGGAGGGVGAGGSSGAVQQQQQQEEDAGEEEAAEQVLLQQQEAQQGGAPVAAPAPSLGQDEL